MGYRLADGLYFCVAGSKATFLDLNANRYFQLPAMEDAAFQRLVSNLPRSKEDCASLGSLRQMGLLAIDPRANAVPQPACAIPAIQSLPDQVPLSPSLLPLTTALAYQLAASIKLATTPIARLLYQITQHRLRYSHSLARRAPVEMDRAVAAFATSTLLLSSSDKCLRRSLAMIFYLADRGFHADLVVGIKDRPFEAHAWVQSGSTVLNDSLGKVIEYTPMVVI